MNGRIGWMWALVLSGCLVVFGVLQAGSTIPPGPLKVGVVDLFKVVDGYQKKKDRESEINKTRDAAAAQLRELQKKIEGMTSELELMDKNSAEFMNKRKMITEKQEELLMKTRLAEREVMERLERYLQELYSEILAKVNEYRERNGYDMIIRLDTRPLTNEEPIITQLDRKLLMSSAQTLDVTDDMIAFLNQSYASK